MIVPQSEASQNKRTRDLQAAVATTRIRWQGTGKLFQSLTHALTNLLNGKARRFASWKKIGCR